MFDGCFVLRLIGSCALSVDHRQCVFQKDATMRRYELTDAAWLHIEPLLPPTNQPGGQWNDHRKTLNGIFWILNSGTAWRDLPGRYGCWESVYNRYQRWTRDGLFDRILETLHLQLDEEGYIDWEQFNIDGTNIRAEQSAAGARKKDAHART